MVRWDWYFGENSSLCGWKFFLPLDDAASGIEFLLIEQEPFIHRGLQPLDDINVMARMQNQSVHYVRTLLLPGVAILTVRLPSSRTQAPGSPHHTKAADDTRVASRLQLLEPFG